MATVKSGFIPELWSSKIMGAYMKQLFDKLGLPKRSKGCQLLRDAALGHKEYPDDVNND